MKRLLTYIKRMPRLIRIYRLVYTNGSGSHESAAKSNDCGAGAGSVRDSKVVAKGRVGLSSHSKMTIALTCEPISMRLSRHLSGGRAVKAQRSISEFAYLRACCMGSVQKSQQPKRRDYRAEGRTNRAAAALRARCAESSPRNHCNHDARPMCLRADSSNTVLKSSRTGRRSVLVISNKSAARNSFKSYRPNAGTSHFEDCPVTQGASRPCRT